MATSTSNTISLHRVIKAPPARVYRAFLETDAVIKWLPPAGFTAQVQQNEAKVGGVRKMSFTNFDNRQSHSFQTTFRELSPPHKLQYIDRFDDPGLPGEIAVTVTLREVSCGTELHVTQQNVPSAIPPEMCYLGWQDSLAQLAMLVENA